MSEDDVETVTGEVVESIYVEDVSEGVQITEIRLEGQGETKQFGEFGRYKLVKVTD